MLLPLTRYCGAVCKPLTSDSAILGFGMCAKIRADVEVPERKLAMTWLLRRNTNQDLAITHTIEFMFSGPADSPFGGIARVPGMLMKQAERTRGEPLSGSSIKVTPTSFLIGLSGLGSDAQRNLELLSERSWLDIPVFYGNGHRAIIAMEKGASGERAFAEAFKAWGEGKRDARAVPRE